MTIKIDRGEETVGDYMEKDPIFKMAVLFGPMVRSPLAGVPEAARAAAADIMHNLDRWTEARVSDSEMKTYWELQSRAKNEQIRSNAELDEYIEITRKTLRNVAGFFRAQTELSESLKRGVEIFAENGGPAEVISDVIDHLKLNEYDPSSEALMLVGADKLDALAEERKIGEK